jgi:chorismate dehydratase
MFFAGSSFDVRIVMKLGYINYLNCYPFYHCMFNSPIAGVDVIPAYPGELNVMMEKGELDVSPISAAAFCGVQDRLVLLKDFCLSSEGYVRSVVLNSRYPIEDLSDKTIGLTRASKTSMVLLKILLQKYYDVNPNYVTVEPDPQYTNIDAALVIGNEAMVDTPEPIQYSYDLGDLWMRKTGYPVVFAVFAAQKDFYESDKSMVDAVVQSYRESLAVLESQREVIVSAAAEKYPRIPYDIDGYYSLLRFNFTDHLREALQFYFNEAASLGLLNPVKEIAWV